MRIIKADAVEFGDFFRELRQRGGAFTPELLASVVEIVREVAVRGDEALFEYTSKFDRYELSAATVEVTADERKAALDAVPPEDLDVIRLAAQRIEKYHRKQVTESWLVNDEEGVEAGQRILPLQRVGIYAPGGKAVYPSTLLMAAIPARIAGV
ncbi:MAG: histidinol dehydrogenase, partial [Deltaproteobacteria bacterium HGW-Deltaproteobacteria-10]